MIVLLQCIILVWGILGVVMWFVNYTFESQWETDNIYQKIFITILHGPIAMLIFTFCHIVRAIYLGMVYIFEKGDNFYHWLGKK